MSQTTKSRPQLPTPGEIAGLPPDGGDEWNRLVFEKSPYLLQHAANPVDWYPWGEEAFAAAREQGKPVFLSVGYATCHWCHVMEHESFENEEVARLMNEAFINVKVDREERPDIDHVYMTVTQAMTGSGGWPMTVIMTPEKKPFFAGTYYPRESRYGRPGMLDLVPHISSLWKEDRAKLEHSAEEITRELSKMASSFPGAMLGKATMEKAFREYDERFEERSGGFSHRPKFPVPHNLSFLLRYHERSGEARALHMVEHTLEKMRLGGIYDHVGFGFHRYSTDEVWLVPHFEKMLYDQALLVAAYVEGWQVTGRALYRQTAEEVLTYVLRDMTAPEGGFYSAEDADSEGEEGKFYVWTHGEVMELLGADLGNVYTKALSITEEGNFHEEHSGRLTGSNIPHLGAPLDRLAEKMKIDLAEMQAPLESARAKLFEVREQRIHPLKDDKVLTDWNGLMIAAFAKAGMAFDNDQYINAARKAADFALSTLRREDGRLLKRYRLGEAGLPAHLEDYAFLSHGLVELYHATFEVRYLRESVTLANTMIEFFWDAENGGFFQSATDSERLFVRAKEAYDGATPSGNSVAALTLARLGRMTANVGLEEKAARTITAFSGAVERMPSQFSMMMMAADFLEGPSHEVVLAGDDVSEMARAIRGRFLPRVVVLHRPETNPGLIVELAPFLEYNTPVEGKATAYVCRNHACEQPVTSVEALIAKLPGGSGR